MNAGDVPFLPRGVRLHHCAIRGARFLLAPERAMKLDDIGAAILDKVDGSRVFSEIVAELARAYAAPSELIGRDVDTFLTELNRRKMLEVR